MATFSPFSSNFSHQRYPGGLYERETEALLYLLLGTHVARIIAFNGQDGVVIMSTGSQWRLSAGANRLSIDL
jgi:hypothetical protein